MAKLTQLQIAEIKDLLEHSFLSQVKIADVMGVTTHTISHINKGKTHHVEGYNYPIRDKQRKQTDLDKPLMSASRARILKIQDDLINTDKTMKQIAKDYDISYSSVTRINSGERSADPTLGYPLRMTGEMLGRRIRVDIARGMDREEIKEKYCITAKQLSDYSRNTKG